MPRCLLWAHSWSCNQIGWIGPGRIVLPQRRLVILGPPKTKSSRRVIPISSALAGVLESQRARSNSAAPEDLVFRTAKGTPLNDKNLYNRELAPACDKIGQPRISWHSFRHYADASARQWRTSENRSSFAWALGYGGDAQRVHPHCFRLAEEGGRASGGDIVRVCGLSWTQVCIGGGGPMIKLMKRKAITEN